MSNLDLYGTEAPPVIGQRLSLGALSFTYEGGALRHIKLGETEVLRSIAFLVRDRDWGTLSPRLHSETFEHTDTMLRIGYEARYESNGARLDVALRIVADTAGLTMSARGVAFGAFETNRAGFTVLHPINGVAGQAVRVEHSDGSVEATRFPDLIAPWQPFMEIAALTHQAGGQSITCRMQGDTFEMEDQRQWGDASFKTYNRPLAKPWPYVIEEGAALEQSVSLTWEAAQAQNAQPRPVAEPIRARFPQMALVITPQDARRLAASPEDLALVKPQRLLCHLDATLGDTEAQFAAFAEAQAACPETAFDLELICVCAPDPAPEMQRLAAEMEASGLRPASVLICPSVDRQSTPPGSDWPECPPLDLVHRAAREAFPNVTRGGGMVSFFPELNRKRPPLEGLEFVSHGLCPIVHAADDLSVMESLEAIPHITRSARAIAQDRAYRIGPATIAMRQNPYGTRTIPNPHAARICMADDDPRHRAAFGAAYAVGLAAALAPAGISVWTPAALYGPRGVHPHWPITQVLQELSVFAGQEVRLAQIQDGIARIVAGDVEITANLTAEPRAGLGGYAWRRRAL